MNEKKRILVVGPSPTRSKGGMATVIEEIEKDKKLNEQFDIALDYPPSEKYRAGYEKICSYLENSEFDCFRSFNVVKREKNYGAALNSSEKMI